MQFIENVKPNIAWKYPRGSRFKDRKIDIRDFVEMIFKYRKFEIEKTRYSVYKVVIGDP